MLISASAIVRHATVTFAVMLFVAGCGPGAHGPRFQPVGAPVNPEAPAAAVVGQAGKKDDAAARKIKYTADVRVICEEFDTARDGLTAAVKQHKGLIAHSEITGSPGSVRAGQWRVRVPVEQYDAFRSAVLKLGEVEKDTSDSEDLTEEYYDLAAHIKNREAEEESLRKLLEKTGDKIENILAVRKELAQVRDDINRKHARLKLLANLTDLTTVNVSIRAKQRFDGDRPPAAAEVPTFGMRVRRTFSNSVEALTAFVQFAVLAAVGLAPWAAVAVVVLAPVVFLYRRAKRNRPRPAVLTDAGPAPQ